ncbi:MAG: 4'-phosphopantetheinyl transferase superfamily protein, partial [bacterium]
FGVAVAYWVSWILLQELGVPVDMIFGQSFGDLSALCAAEALSFDEIIPLYWEVLIDASVYVSDEGRMALVGASEEELEPLLQKFQNVSIAIHITPELQILGGEASQVQSIRQRLQAEGVWTQTLPFPAIHTPYFGRLWEALEPYLEKISVQQPKVPVYSAITVNRYPHDQAGIKQTLIANIDHPIRLWQTTKKMYDDGARIFVQAGGGATTHIQAKNICGADDVRAISLDVDYRSPITQINHLCATLLANGVMPDLKYLFQHRLPRKLELDIADESVSPAVREPVSFDLNTTDQSSAPVAETFVESNSSSDSTSGIKMPYIGSFLHYKPEREIVVERVLDINEDLYLRDHLFIHAPGIKAPSACLPVMPMTFSMEVMAEIASYLAPGLGVIGFENIRAYNWISFENVETLALRISAKLENQDHDPDTRRIAVDIYVENQTSPAISGTVLFGTSYRQELDMEFTDMENPRPHPYKVEEIYQQRYLFHGPNFQCVTGLGELGDRGFIAELAVLPKDHLFASLNHPGLLTEPILLDGVGQLVGLWALVHDQHIFPIGIQKLEFYGPTPPVGTCVPAQLEITRSGSKTLSANIEVQDGEGHVWMRIMGWEDWIFRWTPRLFDFTRLPERYVLSQPIPFPTLPAGCTCLTICREDLKDFELAVMAGYFLHQSEMPEFHNLASNPQRQRQWLLGRIAAKDAVRLWLKPRNAPEMLHPAEFIIENGPNGQPVVRNIRKFHTLPRISIAHSNDRASAIASGDSIGVDLEQITEKNTSFVESFATRNEQALLKDFPVPEQKTWIIRLWGAKEAASKVSGIGLNGRPKDFEAVQLDPDGRITIKHASSEQTYVVNTYQEQDFIMALATDSQCTLQ